MAEDQNNKLYVGNLDRGVKDNDLREMFAEFGDIVEAVVIMDKESGGSKGFGFVTFSSEEDADKAEKEMNGKDMGGRTLTVNIARPREER